MPREDLVRLKKLSSFLHRLSRLAIVFVPAALYFQVRSFMAVYWTAKPDRAEFLSSLLVALSLWGFYMALQSLADSQRLSPAEIAQARRSQKWIRRTSWVVAVAALGVIAFGLAMLLLAGDQLQGIAILCFGVGLLGVARFQIDRLSNALTAFEAESPESA